MMILLEGSQRYNEFVAEVIRSTLPECENAKEMRVKFLKLPHYNMAATKRVPGFLFLLFPVPLGQIYFVLVLITKL